MCGLGAPDDLGVARESADQTWIGLDEGWTRVVDVEDVPACWVHEAVAAAAGALQWLGRVETEDTEGALED